MRLRARRRAKLRCHCEEGARRPTKQSRRICRGHVCASFSIASAGLVPCPYGAALARRVPAHQSAHAVRSGSLPPAGPEAAGEGQGEGLLSIRLPACCFLSPPRDWCPALTGRLSRNGSPPVARECAGGGDRAKGRGAVGPLAVPGSLRPLHSASPRRCSPRAGSSTPHRASAARCPPPPARVAPPGHGRVCPRTPATPRTCTAAHRAAPGRYHVSMVPAAPGTDDGRRAMIADLSEPFNHDPDAPEACHPEPRRCRLRLIAICDTSSTVPGRPRLVHRSEGPGLTEISRPLSAVPASVLHDTSPSLRHSSQCRRHLVTRHRMTLIGG